MADTVIEENGNLHEEKMEPMKSEDKSEKLNLLEHIFSWRGVIYFLLHFTFIAWCIPRSATSMAFVCINSRREKVLRMLNTSSEALKEDQDLFEREDISISGHNFSELQANAYRHVSYFLSLFFWSLLNLLSTL